MSYQTAAELKEALRLALAAALTTRTVSRDFIDYAQRDREELLSGVVCFVGVGEKDYSDTIGREAQLGTMQLILVGQLQVDEAASKHEVEDAEDALAAEIKEFLRTGTGDLGEFVIRQFRQSGQVEFPYGWVAFDLEIVT